MSRQERLAADLAARVAGCPDADALQRLREGTLASREAEDVGRHLRACGACRESVEYLREEGAPGASAPGIDPPVEVTRRSDRLIEEVARPPAQETANSFWTSALRLAAGLVLAGSLSAAGYFWWAGRTQPEQGPLGDLGVLRGGAPLEPSDPIGALPEPPASMRWAPHPQAATYQVILFDEAMNKVWTRETPDSTPVLTLDPQARGAFAAGGRFTWQVVAVGRLGQPLGRSPAAQFSVVSSEPTK